MGNDKADNFQEKKMIIKMERAINAHYKQIQEIGKHNDRN